MQNLSWALGKTKSAAGKNKEAVLLSGGWDAGINFCPSSVVCGSHVKHKLPDRSQLTSLGAVLAPSSLLVLELCCEYLSS